MIFLKKKNPGDKSWADEHLVVGVVGDSAKEKAKALKKAIVKRLKPVTDEERSYGPHQSKKGFNWSRYGGRDYDPHKNPGWRYSAPYAEALQSGERYSAKERAEEAEWKRQRERGAKNWTQEDKNRWREVKKNPGGKKQHKWVIIDPDHRKRILCRGTGGKGTWISSKNVWGSMGAGEELSYTSTGHAINAAKRLLPWASRWETVTRDQYIKIVEERSMI